MLTVGVVVAFCLTGAVSAQVVVDTTYGPVQGTEVPIHTGQVIDSFLAIPFAKAPVDELRFLVRQRDVPTDSILSSKMTHAEACQRVCLLLLLIGIIAIEVWRVQLS